MSVSDPLTIVNPLSVVVVNYNAGHLLLQCVEASLAQAAQVIVVDNCSTDLSMDMLASSMGTNPCLTLYLAESNNGFAAGCNVGIGLAIHPYILFMNPDCILGAGALERLSQVLRDDPHVGMVGGRLVNPDGSEQGGGAGPFQHRGDLLFAPSD